MRTMVILAGIVVFVLSQNSLTVSALTQAQKDALKSGARYFNTEEDGTGSGGSCSPNLIGDNNKAKIWNYFRFTRGLSAIQVAGIMGNMTYESGLEPRKLQGGRIVSAEDLTPSEKTTGWGLVQWTPGSKFIDTQSPIQRANDLGVQLNFLWEQLTRTGRLAEDPSILRDIRSATTLLNAVLAFQGTQNPSDRAEVLARGWPLYYGFERPTDEVGSVDSRMSSAKVILAEFGSGGGTGSDPSCPPGGGIGTSPDGFVFPLRTTQALVKQGFRGQRWCVESQTSCHHDYNAADIVVATGTPVLAVRNGVIANIRVGPARLVLLADNGRSYFYTHMGAGTITVTEGQTVSAGDVIGAVGTDADGEGIRHLHIDELPRPPYDYRPDCGNAACQAYPFIDVQPELISAFSSLP